MYVYIPLPAHIQRDKKEHRHTHISTCIYVQLHRNRYSSCFLHLSITLSCGCPTPKARAAHHREAGTGCWGHFLLVIKKLRIFGEGRAGNLPGPTHAPGSCQRFSLRGGRQGWKYREGPFPYQKPPDLGIKLSQGFRHQLSGATIRG